MRNKLNIIKERRWMMVIALSLIIYQLSFSTAGAQNSGSAGVQSLYEKNIKLGQTFQNSGNLLMAKLFYQKACDEAETEQELLTARLSLADIQKFTEPVEAQRINDLCEETTVKYPGLRQKYLVTNATISFLLNNKNAFSKTYKEYQNLCQNNDTLSQEYDIILKAMNEALGGYYHEALRTLDKPGIGIVIRHTLRIHIFEMSGNKQKAIDELRRRAASIDSLGTRFYEGNVNESNITASMTRAQEQAEKHSSRLTKLNIIMLAVIVIMIYLCLLMYRREQKKLEKKNEQLRIALKMAGESDEMKKEFVKRVSHEIRTPLNAITGFNEILNNSEIELGKEERSDLMNRINENVKAITSIVDELLQVANAESIIEYAKDDTILCNKFFSELLYSHKKDVSASIELEYTTQLLNRFTILSNENAVRKIVEHLIHNAIKFTQKGTITLNCSEKKGMVYLTITDTGCGIPADKQTFIFEQFVKVDEFQQGIGLGLTVARNVAQKLGGDLVLDKDYTDGARFVLTLPVK